MLENLINVGTVDRGLRAAYGTVDPDGASVRRDDERALDATRRDVRAVDRLHAVPDPVDEALAHVADRHRHENAVLTHIREARDEATDPGHKRRAAELVDIVKDCIRRHTRLQSRLLEAGPLFRAEQDRQAFAAPPSCAGLDVYGQLPAPLLPLPMEQALRVTHAFFASGAGLRTPPVVRVGDLVEVLLAPPPSSRRTPPRRRPTPARCSWCRRTRRCTKSRPPTASGRHAGTRRRA